MNPTAKNACSRCGTEVPASSPAGLCPRCLLEGVSVDADHSTAPRWIQPPPLAEVAAAFPHLEILAFLGAGGMGCVYRVRDRISGRVAALKILPRDLASDPAFVERFEREARTLSRLSHPNIVGIHGFGSAGGYCFLLMELVDGANLRQAIRSGRFTPAQALALIPPLCEALQYAHSQGVLHRDIKPENILLDAEGRVKIADFGIAKILGSGGTVADDATLTRTGARLGTPHYMAPEQVEHPEQVDHRADIYSLGVVFYELLTGELPLGRFQVPSAKATLDARIDDIVLRALAKERELRQQSAGQVKSEVEGLNAPSWRDRLTPRWWGWTPIAFGLVALVLFWVGTVGAPELLILVVVITTLYGVRELQRRRPAWRVSLEIATIVLAMLIPSVVFSTNRFQNWGIAKAQRIHVVDRLKKLGLILRSSTVHTPDGEVFPEDLSFVLPELKTNPQTGEAFEYVAAGQTNPQPTSILIQTPDGMGGKVVLLGDGSVQQISETEFQKRREADSMRRAIQVLHEAVGPFLAKEEAEQHLRKGGTVLLLEKGRVRRCEFDVAAAFRAASKRDYRTASEILFRSRLLCASPGFEFVFAVPGPDGILSHGDTYLRTQSDHGGLLAAMIVFAAASGNSEALDWGQKSGSLMWKNREELVLCYRALDGNSDQDTEEIRMRTADVLSLKAGAPIPRAMTVIHRSKAYPGGTRTNLVDLAWPRLP